jgi:hypothetical protein
MVFLTTMSVGKTIYKIISELWIKKRNNVIVAYFTVLSVDLKKIACHGNWSLARDLKLEPPEYDGVLTIQMWLKSRT